MLSKENVMKNAKMYEQIHDEFYALLDKNIPQDPNVGFDFSTNPSLDAKEVYELFYRLDYAARKLRAMAINFVGEGSN